MAAAEALLEYASVGRTDNDRESAQWGSAGQTEAIELVAVGYSISLSVIILKKHFVEMCTTLIFRMCYGQL